MLCLVHSSGPHISGVFWVMSECLAWLTPFLVYEAREFFQCILLSKVIGPF